MELILGFIVCVLVTVGVRLYLRFFATEGVRHKPFERWCRSRPLVMALRCEPGGGIDVYESLRRQIEPHDYFANSQGRYPWQHYAVQLDGMRLENDIVLLFVAGCRQPRLREELPDLAHAIESLARETAAHVEEVWLHGQLHAVNRRTGFDREQLGWQGTFGESGEVLVSAMIGQPPWLQEIASP